MMLGDKVNAAEAEQLGMLYKVYADDIFAEESMKLAITVADMPTQGLAYTKQALNASLMQSFAEQLQTEDRLQFAAAHTEDYKEGINAFIEKRPGNFKGK